MQCKWNPKGKFVGATQLRKWMVVAMIAPGRDAPQQARLEEYVGHLVRIGNSKGMVIAKPTFFYCSQPSEGEAMVFVSFLFSLWPITEIHEAGQK